jgi:hypothetical protein
MKKRRLVAAALAAVALTGCATLNTELGQCLLVEYAFPVFRLLTEAGDTLTTESNDPLRLDP